MLCCSANCPAVRSCNTTGKTGNGIYHSKKKNTLQPNEQWHKLHSQILKPRAARPPRSTQFVDITLKSKAILVIRGGTPSTATRCRWSHRKNDNLPYLFWILFKIDVIFPFFIYIYMNLSSNWIWYRKSYISEAFPANILVYFPAHHLD